MPVSNKVNFSGITDSEVSFDQLIEENQDKIFHLIYGMTADHHLSQDLTQEVFIKAFQSINTFSGDSKYSTWLYRIAVNHTIDYQRKASVRKENVTAEIDNSNSNGYNDPDSACQKTAIKNILYRAIAKLPEQQKQVYVLREINGCSNKEVAEILGCSVELVKWRLHKARLFLRKTLGGENKYLNIGKFSLIQNGLE